MPNPNQLWGQSRITADGVYLQTAGKSTLDVGGIERASVDGDNKAGFFTEMTKPSKVTCELMITAGTSLVGIKAISNATINFACDTGQNYVIRNAYCAGALDASDGKAKVTFEGVPAEEEL